MNTQLHPTFIVQKLTNQINGTLYENLINEKVISLISSTFLILTPCVIIEVNQKWLNLKKTLISPSSCWILHLNNDVPKQEITNSIGFVVFLLEN